MKNKARLFISVLLCVVGAVETMAQKSDFGIWTSAGIEKKLGKQWKLSGELGARTRDNSSTMDRFDVGVGVDYKPVSFLKLSAGYDFLYDHRARRVTYHRKSGTVNKITPSYWWPRHRVLLGVTGSYSIGRFGFSLREMYQYTYRALAKDKKYDTDTEEWEDVRSKSQHLLRSRLEVEYNIKKVPLTPFVSAEMYTGEGGLKKMRYTVGAEWSINKHNGLSLYYRYQDLRENDDDDLDMHVLGIGYEYSF